VCKGDVVEQLAFVASASDCEDCGCAPIDCVCGDEAMLVCAGCGNVYHACLCAWSAPPKAAGLYEDHEGVGVKVTTVEAATFGDGSIVPAGERGVVIRVEPSTDELVWVVQLESYGERGFNRKQLAFEGARR
jgi:hypothetical protein